MALFPPSRPLLHPQFETYRLHSLDPDNDVAAYPLPGAGATQSRVGYNQHHLSFKEVRSRISWNHLAVAGRTAVYVDADWSVVCLELNDELEVTMAPLLILPTPASSSDALQHHEYPSVLPLSPTLWAVSSGSGTLYVIRIDSSTSYFRTPVGELLAAYDLNFSDSPQSEPVPFLLQAAHAVSSSDVRLLLTRAVPPAGEGKGRARSAQTTTFELVEFALDPTVRNVDGEGVDPASTKNDGEGERTPPPSPVVKWVLKGGDLPVWCAWENGGWLVLSGETFEHPHSGVDEVPGNAGKPELPAWARAQRKKAEREARLGLGARTSDTNDEDHDEAEAELESTPSDLEPPTDGRTYPFSWTQDGEVITMTFRTPPGMVRADYTVKLTNTTLMFNLRDDLLQIASPELQAFLHKPTRTFWTNIDLSSSTYSLDEKASTLEITLAKAEEDTRWPAIFLPEEGDADDEVEVPETITASTMASVRATFDNIRKRTEDEPEGNPAAMPALLREEMDFDLDDGEDEGGGAEGVSGDSGGGKVGREVFVGYIKDGAASWSKSTTTVLSTPLRPTSMAASDRDPDEGGSSTILVKSAVDGQLFAPASKADPSRTPWTHQSTSPALAFVLSSKRDLRTVRHLTAASRQGPSSHGDSIPPSPKKAKMAPPPTPAPSPSPTTVLAFDAGGSSAGQGNAYIYYPPTSRTTAKQGVIRVSGGERGALLGVGCLCVMGRDVVVALCEKAVVVLRNVLLSESEVSRGERPGR